MLEKLSLTGTAEAGLANLQLTATIRVREEGWQRVPLHMPTAAVRQPPKHEGPGENFLTYDAALGGHVCWLKGSDPRPHVVTVPISVGLASIGDERRLSIGLPRPPNRRCGSQLAAGRRWRLRWWRAKELRRRRSLGDDRSEISVLGAAGDLQLAWRPGRESLAKGPRNWMPAARSPCGSKASIASPATPGCGCEATALRWIDFASDCRRAWNSSRCHRPAVYADTVGIDVEWILGLGR